MINHWPNQSHIVFLGNSEMQIPSDNGGYTNYRLEGGNPLKESVEKLLSMYYKNELGIGWNRDVPESILIRPLILTELEPAGLIKRGETLFFVHQ